MIDYDVGTWGIWFAHRLYGSIFPKSFVIAFPASLFAVCIHYLLRMDLKDSASAESTVVGSLGAGAAGTSILGGFFFILGFLVVFRSQQAYSRWWEGGTLLLQLRAEWFNATSSLLAFTNQIPEKRGEGEEFQHQVVRLVSLLYASALSQCSTMPSKHFELIDLDGMDKDALAFLNTAECHDPCEVVLQWIQRLIVEADERKTLAISAPVLSRVYNQLGTGIVRLSNARKISMCPIPYPLAQMITVMLLFHSCIVPLICATTLEHPFWCGLMTFVVVISYWSINYISIELEMPFGSDPNDLPLQDMQMDLNYSLKSLLHPKARRSPKFTYSHDKHSSCHTMTVDMDVSLFEPIYRRKTSLLDTLHSVVDNVQKLDIRKHDKRIRDPQPHKEHDNRIGRRSTLNLTKSMTLESGTVNLQPMGKDLESYEVGRSEKSGGAVQEDCTDALGIGDIELAEIGWKAPCAKPVSPRAPIRQVTGAADQRSKTVSPLQNGTSVPVAPDARVERGKASAASSNLAKPPDDTADRGAAVLQARTHSEADLMESPSSQPIANGIPAQRRVTAIQDTSRSTGSVDSLPAGWQEAFDQKSCRSYYWKESDPFRTPTWQRPVFACSPIGAPPA